MLAALLVNLPVSSELPPDKGKDAGSGKKWWEGQWADPAKLYPLERIIPIPVEETRERIKTLATPKDELKPLARQASNLSRAVESLEVRAKKAETDRAIESVTLKYRELVARHAEIERRIEQYEQREEEEFVGILLTII